MEGVNRERGLEFLKQMISFPHPQADMERVKAFIADIVRPAIKALPFDSVQLDPRGNLIAVKKGSSSLPPFVICTYGGSYPAASMRDPYTPKIVQGEPYGLNGPCVWGRSTTEQLSGAAAMLEGVTAFFEKQRHLDRGMIWITNYSGEMGNHEAVNFIFIEQKVPMGPTLLVTASNNHLCLGNLGRIDVPITVQGIACHSSDPSKGKNAILGVYEILRKVYALQDLPTDPDLGKATLTPTMIKTSPDALHTVPALAHVMLDRRLVPGESPAAALRDLKSYIGELPLDLKVAYEEELNFQYPHRANPACELVQAARKACHAVLGGVKTFYKRSALDMGFFSHHGHDSILFGPGNHALAHSDHEMVSLEDFHDACQVYEIILEQMLLSGTPGRA